MVKNSFDTELTPEDYIKAQTIIDQAQAQQINIIINVGTSLIESINCIKLAQKFPPVYATIGIHPNDLTDNWKQDLKQLESYLETPAFPDVKTASNISNKSHQRTKIVAIGETGLDTHYPDYNLQKQQDAFKTQIELALKHDLALVVHTRDAPDETLACLAQFKDSNLRGTIHCFSNDLSFALDAINLGFVIGIGGTLTYPKNNTLRTVATTVPLESIILETDAPYLPIQKMRGKQNHPEYIYTIAQYLAELRHEPLDLIAHTTTDSARKLFRI